MLGWQASKLGFHRVLLFFLGFIDRSSRFSGIHHIGERVCFVSIRRLLIRLANMLYVEFMPVQQRDAILKAFDGVGVLRPKDLASIPRANFGELVAEGLLYRTGRGLYGLSSREVSEHRSLAEVATRVPKCVVCLLSALAFHEITTENPPSVWIAVDRKARRPNLDYPPVEVVRFSGPGLVVGVESHLIDGVSVKVTGVSRTVVDCFKYRNKLGLDLAMEALTDAWAQQRLNLDEVWHLAKVARMENVMRPYLVALR